MAGSSNYVPSTPSLVIQFGMGDLTMWAPASTAATKSSGTTAETHTWQTDNSHERSEASGAIERLCDGWMVYEKDERQLC